MKTLRLLCSILPLMLISLGCEGEMVKSPKPARDVALKEDHSSAPKAEKRDSEASDVNELNKLNRSIIRAAARGDVKRVEHWLLKGANVNAKGKDGRTPLHFAAEEGHNELSEILITNGVDVNTQDNFGQTPLHLAAVKGHKRIVELLLASGTSVDPRDNAWRTPLHYASGAGHVYGLREGYLDIAQLLIDNGAKINAKDKWDWSPLHYASLLRHKNVVALLLNTGAESYAMDERGNTASSLIRQALSDIRGHPAASERVELYREILELLSKCAGMYYVATDGEDSNTGTLQHPFQTLETAVDSAEPGDTILVRGGIYFCSRTIHLDKSGQQGKPIRLKAYRGETPVFDFSASRNLGFLIAGAYWHIKGLAITRAGACGIALDTQAAHHNILEQIIASANNAVGVFVRSGAAHNLILNCDSFRNFDPMTNGENADGFIAGRVLGKGNTFVGCRSWNNSDDGFDFGFTDEGVRAESCYAYRNGKNIWDHPCFTGNANGFKIWSAEIPHVLIHCVAWDHGLNGFIWGDSGKVTLHNCTAFGNRFNIAYWGASGSNKVVVRNSISFEGLLSARVDPNMDDQFNSWNTPPGIQITEEDFPSLDDTVITGPRNPDGSIPESDFLRLAPGSDAIDAGVDVGLPLVGKAPDLGAFEHNPAESGKRGPKMLHQAVRDYDIEKIRKMLAEGTDVNEKDWLGYAPLHWAIYFGCPEVAEILISEGANPNFLSDSGRTPLAIATAMEYAELAELLRKHGATE